MGRATIVRALPLRRGVGVCCARPSHRFAPASGCVCGRGGDVREAPPTGRAFWLWWSQDKDGVGGEAPAGSPTAVAVLSAVEQACAARGGTLAPSAVMASVLLFVRSAW